MFRCVQADDPWWEKVIALGTGVVLPIVFFIGSLIRAIIGAFS